MNYRNYKTNKYLLKKNVVKIFVEWENICTFAKQKYCQKGTKSKIRLRVFLFKS